jgi:hypothetical protein
MNTKHPDDETISAALDGEADEAAQAHVTSCSVCAARVAEFRSLAAAVRLAPNSAPPGVREDAIQAALREAGEPSTLDLARAKRWRRRPPLATLGWVGAAAAAVALLAAIPALLGGGNTSKASVTLGPNVPTSRAPQRAASAVLPAPSAAPSASLPTPDNTAGLAAPGAPVDLGAQTNQSTLANALHAALTSPSHAPTGQAFRSAAVATTTQPAATQTTPGDAVQAAVAARCSPAAATHSSMPATTKPVFVGLLDWKGTAAAVYVFAARNGRVAAVTSQASCTVLVSFPL